MWMPRTKDVAALFVVMATFCVTAQTAYAESGKAESDAPAVQADPAIEAAAAAAIVEDTQKREGTRPKVLPKDITEPTDPVEKAAFDVLDKHCSRCHQEGMLTTRQKPAKNFGHVMDLTKLAAEPQYVQAGNPDGSKLLQQIINKEMPYDVYYEFDSTVPEVTAKDIDALRAWIAQTGDREAAACADRKFITAEEVVSYIAKDLRDTRDDRIRGMRYLTLTNVYNSCAADQDLEVYRQGAVKLLNSFGRTSDVVKMRTIDPAKTILSFNLADLGWDEEDWNKVLAVYPYAVRPDTNEFDFITQQTYNALPYVRADWFGFTASQPPLYDVLLQLPNTAPALDAKLGVDVLANIRDYTAKRAGFQKSGVSRHNRLIERHPISTGYFWTSYDMAGDVGQQSLFLNPLGPTGIGFPNEFKHDGGETIFSLPNGFQGYYLNLADGTQLAKGPIQIVNDPARRDLSVTNGISCMGCHDQGIRFVKDEILKTVGKDRAFSKEARDLVEALYPTNDEMDAILKDDFERFNSAMKRAGLNSTLKLNGVEMTNALFKRYEDDLSLRKAAAEYGYNPDDFKAAFISAGPDAVSLMRRLEQGIVPRDQFEKLFITFVEGSTDWKVLDLSNAYAGNDNNYKTEIARPEPTSTFDLQLTADQTTYNQGDAAVFRIQTNRACNLFVVNVAKDGKGTIIFPNKYQKDNSIAAGERVVLGGDSSKFKFKLPDIGKERVVAVCKVGGSGNEAFGRAIDVESSTFTDVGNFDEAMSRQIEVEANDAREEAKNLDADGRKDAQFAKIATLKQKKVSAGVPESAKQTVASAAIVITVK